MKRVAVFLLLALAAPAFAGPEDAVVKVPSHGGSAVVIQTGPGYTYLLTAGHLFATAREKAKRIEIEAPAPAGAAPRAVTIRLLKMDLREPDTDLALMLMDAGPLPYVCPVADGAEHRLSDDIISVGYDEMRPRTVRKATVCDVEPGWIYTMQRPWHGRSGGGLIDRKANRLIGIVSRYEGNPGAPERGQIGTRGCYVSRKAIIAFLTGAQPQVAQQQFQRQQYQPQMMRGAAPFMRQPCPT